MAEDLKIVTTAGNEFELSGSSSGPTRRPRCPYARCDHPLWPSQREDQVADGAGLGEEGVVAGVEFHDAARPTGELAL
jgi:hypothetical protein